MHIEKNTGLKISYEKTTLYRVGSLKNMDAQIYTIKKLMWSNNDIDILGIKVLNGNLTVGSNNCYKNTIAKMKQVCENWYLRSLSVSGKVVIINALMSSLFVYRMMVLPAMPKNIMKEVNNIVTEFLWKGRRSKISLSLLQNPKEFGGLKLVDFAKKHTALKIGWIMRVVDGQAFNYIHFS